MKEEKLRNEVDSHYKWDLEAIYQTEEEYENDKQTLIKLINEIPKYKGKISNSGESLLQFLQLDEQILVLISNLYLYASCKKDEDLANSENQKRYNEILNILSLYDEQSNFVMPELMKTDKSIIQKYIEENEKLKEYEFDLNMMYRYQKYTLSDKEELLLSNLDELQTKFKNNYDIVLNSIINYGIIEDEEHNKVQLTMRNYLKYARSNDRRVRKDAFNLRGEALKKFANLISVDYQGHLKADAVIAKTKGYKSDLEMYLYPDGVSEDVYDNLLKVADEHIDSLYKYYRMIKKVTGLKELEVYDITAPLTKISNQTYTPEDAKKIIVDALSIYGEEYKEVLESAFDNHWIDFYPNKGKRSGYYENAAFKGHPFVFGNFISDFGSVSAIAHELGHAMHSYFSNKSNSPHLAEYTIFVAEVASLTNEVILANYIVNNSSDKNEKLLAIENILEIFASNFFGTLSEGSIFEREVHKRVFNGETLTEIDFNSIYEKVKRRYYGPDVKMNEFVKYNWCRVPHFYSSFYYYKYSIGISCACYCAKKILSGDREFLEKYLKFLTLGGSMMPLDELKTLGIDLLSGEVIEEAISYFDSLIDEFEKINNEVR